MADYGVPPNPPYVFHWIAEFKGKVAYWIAEFKGRMRWG
jgi:hypothetical protein